MMELRRACAADCPEIAALLTDAFDGYPIYAAAQGLIKPGFTTREMLLSLNRTVCNFFMRYNKACFLADDEGATAGIAMLEAPGETNLSLHTALLCGALEMCRYMSIRSLSSYVSTLLITDSEKCVRGKSDLYILNLAVHELWRGQGVARALIFDGALPYAREKGCTRLTLTTNTARNAAMYAHMGFKTIEQHDVDFAGQRITYYHMAMNIE